MDEKWSKILIQSAAMFMRLGIKSVTMDDVARELKMSKKTLYQYVDNKDDLVLKVFGSFIQMEQATCLSIAENNENAIDEMIEISKHVNQTLNHLHPSIHFDMEKYYPETWKIFNKHKTEFVYDCMLNNMKKGIKQGLYRKNLLPDVIAKLFIEKMDMFFDGKVFPPNKYNFAEVHLEYMRYHIRGISTEKGIEYLMQKLKQEKFSL